MAGVSTGGASTGNATEAEASERDVRSINYQMKATKFPAYHPNKDELEDLLPRA